MNEPRFQIGGVDYPFPTKFTLGDGPLVYEATGLEFDEWSERIDNLEQNPTDVRAMTGVVAVAVARQNPSWSRQKVVKFLNDVDLENFRIEGGDDDPPAEPPATAENSPVSSTASTTSQVDTLEGPD